MRAPRFPETCGFIFRGLWLHFPRRAAQLPLSSLAHAVSEARRFMSFRALVALCVRARVRVVATAVATAHWQQEKQHTQE